ncbi:MAG: hypothetical protein LBC67_07090 [Spirochaetales bacterium]|jgi:hypothetical protein|nr:hypothetical protein [Spirochaetales bacterium]
MKTTTQSFEENKETALRAARTQGIVDVVHASNDGISLETLELATRLTQKHSRSLYAELEKRRSLQK